jgi:hypothetical protein
MAFAGMLRTKEKQFFRVRPELVRLVAGCPGKNSILRVSQVIEPQPLPILELKDYFRTGVMPARPQPA